MLKVQIRGVFPLLSQVFNFSLKNQNFEKFKGENFEKWLVNPNKGQNEGGMNFQKASQ
jgi:hypothetical protein